MKRHKPSPDQLELPYKFRKRIMQARLGVSTNVKLLLWVLFSYCHGERPTCWPGLESIAAGMDCSVSTVKRTIREAIAADVLARLQRKTKFRQTNKYLIPFAELATKTGLLDSLLSSPDGEDEPSRGVNSELSTSQVEGSTVNSRLKSPEVNSELSTGSRGVNSEPRTPTLTRGVISPPPSLSPESKKWKGVEMALIEFGVARFRTAIAAAQAHGCAPSFVLDLIQYATQHKADWPSPAGVLWHRVCEADPRQAVNEGWPPPSVASKRLQSVESVQSGLAERLAADDARRKADQERRQQREERYGEILDSLGAGELERLAKAAFPGLTGQRMYKAGGASVRAQLLLHLEKQLELSPVCAGVHG